MEEQIDYWNLLPYEIREIIVTWHKNSRDKSIFKLQRMWKNYYGTQLATQDMLLDLTYYYNEDRADMSSYFDCTQDITIKILKHCSKVLSGRNECVFWPVIIIFFNNSLIYDDNFTLEKDMYKFIKVQTYLDILSKKFKLKFKGYLKGIPIYEKGDHL